MHTQWVLVLILASEAYPFPGSDTEKLKLEQKLKIFVDVMDSNDDELAPIREAYPPPAGFARNTDPKDAIPTDVSLVKFILYQEKSYDEIKIDDAGSIDKSKFKRGRPLKILIHGFTNDRSSEFPKEMREAYTRKISEKDFNVLVVDWGPLAASQSPVPLIHYDEAVENVERVGKHLGRFISFLLTAGALSTLDDVHLLGFSLGGHVAGVAGHNLSGRLGRITGLDPAGPRFGSNKHEDLRLDHKDAKFIDVIHTDGGNLGTDLDGGHVDFYPDGGRKQSSCSFWEVGCSHKQCHIYYRNTIGNKETYKACRCSQFGVCDSRCQDSILVGEDIPKSAGGYYYFDG